jgi:integration host factor subunit beta
LKERYPGLRGRDARIAVRAVVDRLSEALIRGERIEIRRFGSLKVKEKRARRYRHPRSHRLATPASAVWRDTKFRPSRLLVAALKRDPVGTCAPADALLSGSRLKAAVVFGPRHVADGP